MAKAMTRTARDERQREIVQLLQANGGALCIGRIVEMLPVSRRKTRDRLLELQRAGLLTIDDTGRRRANGGGCGGGVLVQLTSAP